MSKLIYGKVQKMTCILLLMIVFLFSQRFSALASSVDTVQVTAAPLSSAVISKNGMVRIYLSSLGNPPTLNVTVRGNYSLSTNQEYIDFGTQVKVDFNASNGQITLTYDGKTINAGKSATLRRHDKNGENGLLIAQAYESGNLYPGDLSFEAVAGNGGYTLYTIAHIYIEDYLYGVLPYEMSNSSGLEALKAQAVAARTYTVRMMQQRASGMYDVKDTTSDQVYRGTPSGNANCFTAVDATKGIVMMNGSSYITTFYSASNGGQTEISRTGNSYSYMKVKDDPFDYANPNASVKKKTIYTNLQSSSNPSGLISVLKTKAITQLVRNGYSATSDNTSLGTLTSVVPHTPMYASPSRLYTAMDFSFTVSTRSASGQTVSVPVTVTMSIFNELESMLNMSFQTTQNELWTVAEKSGSFEIQVRRYGHGMGMSQRGAMYMAKLGYTYDEILGFYFEGCSRVKHQFSSTVLGSSGSGGSSSSGSNSNVSDAKGNASVNLNTGDRLFILAARDSGAKVIGIAPDGAKVEVLVNEGNWSLIRYGEIVGYVHSSTLLISGTVTNVSQPVTSAIGFANVTANDYLNLRQSGSTSAKVVGTAPSGAVLTVFSKSGSWAKVQYNSLSAYVNTGFISAVYSLSDEETSVGTGETAYVTTASGTGTVNLRYSRSTSSKIVAQLPVGTQVTVSADDGEWSSISCAAGNGYMMSRYLRYGNDVQTPPAATEELTAYVATQQGSLNLRAQPSAGSRIVTSMPKGAQIVVTDKGPDWCAVRYNGHNGYAMTEFLSFGDGTGADSSAGNAQQTATVVTSGGSLNLRQQPNTGAAVLKQVPSGSVLLIIERGEQWCKAAYRGSTGYVMTSFLSFGDEDNTNTGENENVSHILTAFVNTQSGSLNLRSFPTSSAVVLASIPRNAAVEVLDRGEEWSEVKYANQKGYVMTKYLRFDAGSSDSSVEVETFKNMWVLTESGSLNMRESASTSARILTTVPKHAKVTVIREENDWCYVEYGSYRGYVMKMYLSERDEQSGTAEELPENMNAGQAKAFTHVDTPIYAYRSTEDAELFTVPAGVEVQLLLDGEEWCCISYLGVVGYCEANDLNVSYE